MPAASNRRGVTARCAASHNLILSALVLAYVVLGAFLFQSLEAGHELRQRAAVRTFRDDCLRELWLITERLNVLYERNWTHLVDEQLRKFERNVVEATKRYGYEVQEKELRWSFSGALLYSVTVVTTIGYGNVAPKTAEGKLVTMLYALFGVPLMLICLSSLGTLLANTFQVTYAYICCIQSTKRPLEKKLESQCSKSKGVRGTLVAVNSGCGRAVCSLTPDAGQYITDPRCHRSPFTACHEHDSEEDDLDVTRGSTVHDTPSRVPLIWRGPGESRRAPTPPPRRSSTLHTSTPPRVPAVLVVFLLLSYISLGAVAFSSWENWSLIDGAYFCFVTLSTIGFGDLMPGKSLQRTDSQASQLQTVACCAYLILGLVIIAMSFSLVQEEVINKSRHLAKTMGLIKQNSLSV